ncbi:MAG: hypothetical protein NXY59_00230 [Aigarchaeota archaeon]|nr:hypothetical protein [Candidatus Pelearchaeum maunauluense]
MPIDVLGILLECSSNLNPIYFSGFHLRGLFYKVLRSFDPGFAGWLHGFRGLAPFSISPLMKIDSGTYIFRITSYLTKLSDALIKAFSKTDDVELLNRRFRVVEISYKRLDLERFMRDSVPYTRYELDFLSPTCFRRPCPYIPLHLMGFLARIMKFIGRPRSHYRFLPLPEPILMLRNLRRQWQQYAGFMCYRSSSIYSLHSSRTL